MRNSTAAHTGWLAAAAAAAASYNSNYYMTFCRCTVGPKFNFPSHCAIFVIFWRFLTIFGGAQWDQSSIFRPTVQFLSFLVIFCRFLTMLLAK